MSIHLIDCEQNSPEWDAARLGLATTSKFKDILAKGKGLTRAKYMRVLAGERVAGAKEESFHSAEMERGHIMEAEARAMYEFRKDVETTQIGFVKSVDVQVGSSPDRFVGEDGILEIKTAKPSVLIEHTERGMDIFPPTHMAQCQGQLWVCEKKWLDLCIYWPGMPFCVWRLKPDTTFIYDLQTEVKLFNRELAKMVERIEAVA